MDKFVIRTPRASIENSKKKTGTSLKQITIESLKGVVVVNDIQRLKSKLKVPDQDASILLECLQELSLKIPPRHVLHSTKIGNTINKLRKHPDKSVSREASVLVKKWCQHFAEFKNRSQIEVKCDSKTEKIRKSGCKHLALALSMQESDSLVNAIEQEVFCQSKRFANFIYRRTMRTIFFKLKHSLELRTQVVNKSLSVQDLVKQFRK